MEKRGRAWVEVDLGAIANNFQQIQRRAGSHTTVMAVVKGDAYGHGAVPVARTLEAAGAGFFGVATADEGLELRDAGVSGMILILGCISPQQAVEIVAAGITPTVHSVEDAKAFSAAAGDSELAVHIKVDSGLCRMGVRCDEVAELCERIKGLENLRYEGIFSHIANAGYDDEFSAAQIAAFREAAGVAAEALGPFKWQHTCASAATVLYHAKPFNMVRPGVVLYGALVAVPAEKRPPIIPAMNIKARLALVKRMEPGDKIGYGSTYEVKERQYVGVVPIGYGDGYRRHLSNRADVIIRGKRRAVLGRVSMDATVVGLGGEADCVAGDEVVLLGHQGDEEIRVGELAERADSIVEDIFGSVGKRLPRIYQE